MWGRGKRSKEKICPYVQGPCLEHGCEFYQNVIGTEPQSGAPINQFACAINLIPMLLIELSKQTYSVGAAVESRGNDTIESLQRLTAVSQSNITKELEEIQAVLEGVSAEFTELQEPPAQITGSKEQQ
jgi:hypothetical protein